MSVKENMQLMSSYNQWMNQAIYKAVGELSYAELVEDKGAFFGSVLGTLNHNIAADIIWLKRFADHFTELSSLDLVRTIARPAALNIQLFDDLLLLQRQRFELDLLIITMMKEVTDEMLASALVYKNMKGIEHSQRFGFTLQHFFNHQTHHRGQITTLLSQMGADVGVTDLITTIPPM
ncbi:damage-inducible protein DinB [Marinomonas rhizomae]|uniref:Putative damage-inducible protein DinB n=1 Tax=Marinomonas rhizomae TaxID=491948 RepID=A0A366ITF8_9GAMM|nr:DinB family protein [Marinomonas rhizomae]RBP78053.1 putative damage-inducible protein DinB [Marinomonas rhizomae]RNF69223.1 damage-inducible protein DinB [Marinomonas rhizomae]